MLRVPVYESFFIIINSKIRLPINHVSSIKCKNFEP